MQATSPTGAVRLSVSAARLELSMPGARATKTILGDSLTVMASLLERERMAGQVGSGRSSLVSSRNVAPLCGTR